MFFDQMRASVESALRRDFPSLRATLYSALTSGALAEDQVETLDSILNARQQLPPVPPRERRVSRKGSRPRSPESLERRRGWMSSGWLAPQFACRFTPGEQAVLAVVAKQVAKHGACTLYNDAIAALAGVCRTTVKAALREAEGHKLVRVEERRLTAWRNDSNRVTITSAEWHTWLKIRGRAGTDRRKHKGGVKLESTTRNGRISGVAPRRDNTILGAPAAPRAPESGPSSASKAARRAAEGSTAKSVPLDRRDSEPGRTRKRP